MDGPWSLISGAGAADTEAASAVKASVVYTPAADIAGMYLRVTVTYTDKHGDDKTAMAVSANAVRAVPSGTNSAPIFPVGADYDRDVDENSPPGTNVGDPVKASDSPGEILTYTLSGDEASLLYSIDRATGQISVGARTMLDREESQEDPFEHTVMVTATDPYGPPVAPVIQEVTITINDVNEAPTVSGGPTRIKHQEGSPTIDLDSETDPVEMPIYAATDTESTDIGTPDACTNADAQVSTCAWSLEGPDAADFTIGDGATDGPVFGLLAFKNAPDFENPADADMDNVYEITVKVTDNGVANKNKMSATRDVLITVTNDNEDGEVTFSSVQPKVVRPFTATLNDPDGMTTGVTWQWWKSIEINADPVPDFLDANGDPITTAWEKIADAKSDTYKPVSDDVSRWLIAMATYTDPVGSNTAMGASDNAVAANTDNVAPEFREGGGKPVMQAIRKIDENSVSDTDQDSGNVGEPVAATDPNENPEITDDPEGILTYTLGGPDKDSFEIDASSGQITVGADTELDYESNKKTYMVTVTATDPSQAMTTIDVTINVTDVNEPPSFTAPSEGDVDKTVQENARSLNIYTFQATDPERRKVYWSLSDDVTSPDRDQFTISDRGALILNASPDYEGLDTEKQYTVIVVASDDAPGAGIAAGDEDPIKTSMKIVTVTVTDVEETGTITLAPKYPHVGNEVMANLTDGDGTPSITWKWTVDGDPVGGDTDSYNPVAGDVGETLRVEASYTEGGDGKVVGPVSAGTVRAAPEPANKSPAFEDTPENNARKVAENARVGTRLGNPIKAIDEDNRTLTYTVNNANFSISSSGQLSTAAMLNHEDDSDSVTTADGETQTVTITATDPWGDSGSIDVDVTVEDVNEAPMLNSGPTRSDRAENTDIATLIGAYGATDFDDGDALTWSLDGEDSAMFSIVEDDGMLTFKESPNYEMPADRNKDNVYKVTVVVSDDGAPKLMDKRQVEISVTDVEEEGTVTLSAVQPKTGIDLMASLTDPDNVTSTDTDGRIETGVTWQWWKSTDNTAGAAPGFLDGDGNPITTAWEKIADAKSDTYKPVSDDVSRWLIAMATYTDRRGSVKLANMSSANAVIVNNDNVAPMFEKNNEEITEATREVMEDAKPNAMDDDADTNDINETMQGNVGDPVRATDPNPDDLLTYTLSGSDAALFKITSDTDTAPDVVNGRGGQISLKTGTELDYEGRTTYMVTVTAADPDGEMASVDVTIKVTDFDEAPMISTGPSIVGPAISYYDENDMAAVASYQGAALNSPSWSLSGDDAGDFGISSDGMLTFNNTPDYEMPEDAGRNNVYDVTVEATDGTNTLMKDVKVMVTNVEEMGTVTLMPMSPSVGTEITATLTDPDMVTENTVMWQWSKSMTMDAAYMDIDMATSMTYTPVEADEGYYLKATASYTDGHGSGKMEMATTTSPAMVPADQMGMVTLSTQEPMAGMAITATLTDPDMMVTGTTWQWSKSMTMDGTYMDIDMATSMTYTPVEADEGYYLKATASYTDGHGSGKMAMATTTSTAMVPADQMGMVTLSTQEPMAGMAITATLTDPDMMVTGTTWQWSKSMNHGRNLHGHRHGNLDDLHPGGS